jgi:hypothetical protein
VQIAVHLKKFSQLICPGSVGLNRHDPVEIL